MGIFGVHTAFCGLGKPTIKLEFEDNASLLDFRQKMQEAEEGAPQNADFVDTEAEDVTGRKELKGVDLNYEDFFEILNKNSEPYIYRDFNEENLYKEFGKTEKIKDSNNIEKEAFKVKTPLKKDEKYVWLWKDLNHALFDNSSKEDRSRFWSLIKPTLERPGIVFSKNNTNYFIKCFETQDGTKIYFSFIPCLIDVNRLKSFYVRTNKERKKKDLYKIYKEGGFLKYMGDVTTINGVDRREDRFIFVDCLLYCGKENNKFSDNQNFNKILEGFGKTANPLLYNNLDILESRGMKPTYKQLENYDDFFDTAKNLDSFSGFGLSDTKKLIKETCLKHYTECYKIAQHLKADSMLQSAYNLWHWLHHNIRYEYDREGREEIRTPLRTWADRKRGVDCDCLSVFAWCVLRCMGYNPAFELAAFRNKEQFSHIYINLKGILIDRVWFIFNCLPPHVTKRELFFITKSNNLGNLF